MKLEKQNIMINESWREYLNIQIFKSTYFIFLNVKKYLKQKIMKIAKIQMKTENIKQKLIQNISKYYNNTKISLSWVKQIVRKAFIFKNMLGECPGKFYVVQMAWNKTWVYDRNIWRVLTGLSGNGAELPDHFVSIAPRGSPCTTALLRGLIA